MNPDARKDDRDRDDRLVLLRKPWGLTPAIARRVVSNARAQVGAKFDVGGITAEALNDTFLGYLVDSLFGCQTWSAGLSSARLGQTSPGQGINATAAGF